MNNYLSNNLTDSRANENNEQGLGMTDDEIRELIAVLEIASEIETKTIPFANF